VDERPAGRYVVLFPLTMAESNQLPHLLKLLDDDSEVVREAVGKELFMLGPELQDRLARLEPPLDSTRTRQLHQRLREYSRQWIRKQWGEWQDRAGQQAQLEAAFGLITNFQRGGRFAQQLTHALDRLAHDCQESGMDRDIFKLAHYLFAIEELKGAERDYYNPRNSDLLYVIENKCGIPISLACTYMLVGDRLGLTIEGCGLPGHFMAKAAWEGKLFLIDCHNGGTVLSEESVVQMSAETHRATRSIIHQSTDARAIIQRVLRNLDNAYHRSGQPEDTQLMRELLKETP